MSLTTKRQLPNINQQKIHDNNQQTNRYSSTKIFKPVVQHRNRGQPADEVQLQFDEHLKEIKRKLTTSIFDEPTLAQLRAQVTQRTSQQNSSAIRESTKNELMREQDRSVLLNRQRRTGSMDLLEAEQRQKENEYLIQQHSRLSTSAALNEMLSFKKELEKSEQKRQQLVEKLESLKEISNDKDKIISKGQYELKDMMENCDTLQRQNLKLQQDLSLALEKLEEMTEEAERFAQESLTSQKQLADSEQKREEFHIQTQETNKQWNAKVKKLEKDLERSNNDSTQILEKNQQLNKEIDSLKSQCSSLKDQISKLETDLAESNSNSKELEQELRQYENNNVQLRSVNSSQDVEINTLKQTISQLENQFTLQRQRLAQTERDRSNLQELLDDETKHRANLVSKLQQSEHELESLTSSYSVVQHEKLDFSQKLKELQYERDSLAQENARYRSLQTDYQDVQQKLESTKSEYTRGMKALQMDYEKKIETLQSEFNEEKSQHTCLQKQNSELKNEFERLNEKLIKSDEENKQNKSTIEQLEQEIHEKIQFIQQFESKLNRFNLERTQKDQDFQTCLENIYKDLVYCTECLSNDSNQPFRIESATTPRDQTEIYSNKIKGHLIWLKQEIELRFRQETKIRDDLKNALIDCEADRKYFAAELAKRELIIDQFTTNQIDSPRIYKNRNFTEDQLDDRSEQFQTMIDSIKHELHTAKAQLLS